MMKKNIRNLFLLSAFTVQTMAHAGIDEAMLAFQQEDYRTAVNEFKPLAEQGDIRSQFHLGLIYGLGGGGVSEDLVQAYKWFSLAIEAGNDKAKPFRDSMTKIMSPSQIEQAKQLTKEWLKKTGSDWKNAN